MRVGPPRINLSMFRQTNSNHGVPNQYTHPQINFTCGHASWEKENFVGAERNRLGVYLFVRLFNGLSILIAHNR